MYFLSDTEQVINSVEADEWEHSALSREVQPPSRTAVLYKISIGTSSSL